MGSLIFSCPETWRVIETGIETDDATLARLRSHSLSVDCPYCHKTHEFEIKDGHLFKMRPRRSQIYYTGLLCDEVDVGAIVQRTLLTPTRPGERPGSSRKLSRSLIATK
jgi:hypothetical protein